jgi:hypothetical protein
MENSYRVPPPPPLKVVVPPPPPTRLVVVPPPPPLKKHIVPPPPKSKPTMAELNGWVPKKIEKWKSIKEEEKIEIPYDDGYPEVQTVFNGGPHNMGEEQIPF